jgi:hypothetical protein
MLTGLKEIGCEVTFLSSTLSSETTWEASSVQSLEAEWVRKVLVYEQTSLDYRFIRLLSKFHRLVKTEPPLNSALHSPLGMRYWFTKILQETSPDIIMMNYAYWDGLLNHKKYNSVLRIIDIYDLVTLNSKMQQFLRNPLSTPKANIAQIDDQILLENFFEKLNLTVSPEEFKIFDNYDYTISITSKEIDIIKKNTQKTKVAVIPVTQEPCYLFNTYNNSALFPTGPNFFNLQGYFYFVKRVLPQVLKRAPSFSLQVTGACCDLVSPTNGIVLSGFVPELRSVYKSAKFVICPVFGGTGQQIKIVEAMAHGVPVIALRFAAERSPIQHKVNGLVADNAEEFADYVLQLWNDEELCRKLGYAARETIAADFSKSRLLEGLSAMLKSQ